MSHFIKCIKVHAARKALETYQYEKLLSLGKTRGTLLDRIRQRCDRCTSCCQYYISRLLLYHYIGILWRRISTSGTFENYITKSFIGFLGGCVLIYLIFFFMVLQLRFSELAAARACMVMGPMLTLGLAFSENVRCMVLLVLPQFFSRHGRQALLAYAFILALSGPGRNTLHNTQILSSSLACGQEQLKSMARQVKEALKKPFLAIRDAMRWVMRHVKKIAVKIRNALLAIKRIIVSIAKAVRAASQWLRSVLSVCHNKLGTPYERCARAFDGAIADCRARLGRPLRWLCSIALLVKMVCHVLRLLDLICAVVRFVGDAVVSVIGKKLKSFLGSVRDAFYVSLETHHAFAMQTDTSKSLSEVAAGILAEVRHRAAYFIGAFDWMSSSATLAIALMIIKALYFRYSFLTVDHFENMYLTDELVELDLRRAALGRETLLPLNRREKRRYVPLRSCTLAWAERRRLAKTAAYLASITLKLCIHICTDYGIYWMLMLIRRHGGYTTEISAPGVPKVQIQGDGILASLLRSVVDAFTSIGIKLKVDTTPCLPDPSPPDINGYWQILSLAACVWAMALLEPLGLRVRHAVLRAYHPARARQRAVWLYNHLLRRRGSFVKMARRFLRRLLAPGSRPSGADVKALLLARCPCLWVVLGRAAEACAMCGEPESPAVPLLRCPTPGCPGLYCEQCFGDIGSLCPGCHMPLEYGDLSDVSLERDSSEEEAKESQSASLEDDTSSSSSTSAVSSGSSDDDDDDDPGTSAAVALISRPTRDVSRKELMHKGSRINHRRGFAERLRWGGGEGSELRRRRRGRGRSGAGRHGTRRRRARSSSGSSRHSYQYQGAGREGGRGRGPLSARERAASGLPQHFRDVEAQPRLDLACLQQFHLPPGFCVPDFQAEKHRLLYGDYQPGWAIRNCLHVRRQNAGPADLGGAGDFSNNDYLFSPITSEGSTISGSLKSGIHNISGSGDSISIVSSFDAHLSKNTISTPNSLKSMKSNANSKEYKLQPTGLKSYNDVTSQESCCTKLEKSWLYKRKHYLKELPPKEYSELQCRRPEIQKTILASKKDRQYKEERSKDQQVPYLQSPSMFVAIERSQHLYDRLENEDSTSFSERQPIRYNADAQGNITKMEPVASHHENRSSRLHGRHHVLQTFHGSIPESHPSTLEREWRDADLPSPAPLEGEECDWRPLPRLPSLDWARQPDIVRDIGPSRAAAQGAGGRSGGGALASLRAAPRSRR